jgi:proline iminopeptidase
MRITAMFGLLIGLVLHFGVDALAADAPRDGGARATPEQVRRGPKVEQGFVRMDDGTRLYYRKTGSGPLKVIAPYDLMIFDVMRQLADIATVVTYDTRSRGRSEPSKNPAHLTIQQDVRDLEAVRAHFHFEKFAPIGFSYLGKAVALYAVAHPDRVTRIVQIGASPIREEPTGEAVDADLVGAPAADVARMRQMRKTDAKQRWPEEFCRSEWRVTRYMLVGNPVNARKIDVDRICMYPNEWPLNADTTLAPLWESVDRTVPTAEELRTITVPVLTIHGTKDRNAAYSGARTWAATLPNDRLLTVTNAGHVVWADDSRIVISAIREFLSGKWPTDSEKVRNE